MKYRIEFKEGKCCKFADGREALLKLLETERGIEDIRKIYKSGVSESVMDLYRKYLIK